MDGEKRLDEIHLADGMIGIDAVYSFFTFSGFSCFNLVCLFSLVSRIVWFRLPLFISGDDDSWDTMALV